jgi:hypothetical protein
MYAYLYKSYEEYETERTMSTAAQSTRRHTAILAMAGLALALAVTLAAYAGHGGDTHGWVMAARYTARLAFVLFMIVFLLAPAMRVTGAALLRPAMRERRGLGLAFAAAHFTHLAALIMALVALGEAPALLTVIFGGFGYVLLAAMALTSNDAALRRIGPQTWRRLHTFGLYYLWFIFTYTYLGRVQRSPEMVEYWLLLGLAVLVLAFRLGAPYLARRRMPLSATAAA